jgi:DNA-binding beta-propeller fold protein YncE
MPTYARPRRTLARVRSLITRSVAVLALSVASLRATDADLEPGKRPVPELGYTAIPDFFQLPAGANFGEGSGVALNSRGHLFVFHRGKSALMEFSPAGKFLRSLGDGLFDHAHGLRIDADDNLWTTDDTNHTVLKLSPEGRVLLVLGRRDTSGEEDWLFNRPTDVAFSRQGDIYVTDGYGNARVVMFDRQGKFLRTWGKRGTGPGEFILPHSVVVDREGRVYVGDRENQRIQIFDAEGRYLREWAGIGYPYGLFLTPDQHVWMADGGFNRVIELDPSGKILGALGEPGRGPGQFAWAHFLAIGPDRRLFVADILNWRIQAFAPTPPSGRLATYVPSKRHFFFTRPPQFSTPSATPPATKK